MYFVSIYIILIYTYTKGFTSSKVADVVAFQSVSLFDKQM